MSEECNLNNRINGIHNNLNEWCERPIRIVNTVGLKHIVEDFMEIAKEVDPETKLFDELNILTDRVNRCVGVNMSYFQKYYPQIIEQYIKTYKQIKKIMNPFKYAQNQLYNNTEKKINKPFNH